MVYCAAMLGELAPYALPPDSAWCLCLRVYG